MKEVYQMTREELEEAYGTSTGITTSEAEERLEKYGPNELEEKGKKSVFVIFLSQFADLLVIILIIAAVISMISGNVESTVVIFAVIILVKFFTNL